MTMFVVTRRKEAPNSVAPDISKILPLIHDEEPPVYERVSHYYPIGRRDRGVGHLALGAVIVLAIGALAVVQRRLSKRFH